MLKEVVHCLEATIAAAEKPIEKGWYVHVRMRAGNIIVMHACCVSSYIIIGYSIDFDGL